MNELNIDCVLKRRNLVTETSNQREDNVQTRREKARCVRWNAEPHVYKLRMVEMSGSNQKLEKRQQRIAPSLESSEAACPADDTLLQSLASRIDYKIVIVLSHLVCGALSQPQEVRTDLRKCAL